MSKGQTIAKLTKLFELQKFKVLLIEANKALALYPEDSQILCHVALAQNNLMRLDDALKTTERAIASAPNDYYAWYLRSLYLTRRLRPQEALEAAQRATDLLPTDVSAVVQLSIAAYDDGKWALADNAVDMAIKLAPNSAITWANKGKHANWKKQWSAAETSFLKALEIQPNRASTLTQLAEVFTQQGKYEEAVDVYRRAIVSNPRWSNGLMGLSRSLEATGDFPEAIDYAFRAVQMYPNRHYVTSHWIRLLSRFEPERAAEKAQEHVERFPKEAGAWTRLANCLIHLNRFSEATEAARTAVKVTPSDEFAYHTLTHALLRSGHDEEALSIAQERVRLATTPYPWHCLALRSIRTDKEAALKAIETAIEIAPDNPETLNTAAVIFLTAGQGERAIAIVGELLRVAPEDHSSWEQNAWIRFYLRDGFPEALASAREHCHSRHEHMMFDAMALIVAEDWEAAGECLRGLLDGGGHSCEAAAYYGAALAHLGQGEEAKNILEGGAVGRSRARLCPSHACPNSDFLAAEIEKAASVDTV